MTRVLCIAAHPDDEVLGVGGTLLKHKAAGDEVRGARAPLHACRLDRVVPGADEMGVGGHPPARDLDGWFTSYSPTSSTPTAPQTSTPTTEEVHERTLVACRPQSGVRAIYAFETPSATDWSVGRSSRSGSWT